jgi:hypothetical protein
MITRKTRIPHPPFGVVVGGNAPRPDGDTEIRTNHPVGFRSGTWARLVRVVEARGRDCYLVEFPDDGATDLWVVNDPDAMYEFRDARSTGPGDGRG